MMLLTLLLASLFGEFLLTFIFKEQIKAHVYLLNPIIIATITMALLSFLCMLETVLRDLKAIIISCIAGFVADIVLSYIFILRFGINGASYALIFSNIITLILLAIFIITKLKRLVKVYE